MNPRCRQLVSLVAITILTTLATAGCASTLGGDEGITMETTCRDYLAFDDQARGAAVRTLGVEMGWSGAGSPFARLNFDAHCGQRPDQTMETALGLFAN